MKLAIITIGLAILAAQTTLTNQFTVSNLTIANLTVRSQSIKGSNWWGEPNLHFGFESKAQKVTTITNTVTEAVPGHFWTEWEVKEGCAEPTRATGPRLWWEDVAFVTNGGVVSIGVCVTNYANSWIQVPGDNGNIYIGSKPCEKEHIDRSPQEDVTYTQSNLVAYLVWRNQTNVNYLESLCVHTNRVKWHWDKVKVYDK